LQGNLTETSESVELLFLPADSKRTRTFVVDSKAFKEK
jgi:hypothetical protein